MNGYTKLACGHLYQDVVTGAIPTYSKEYSEERYDKYETTRPMSELRFALCKELFKFDSVLDFGYGNGDFLSVCANNGVKSFGYDVSDYPLKKPVIKTESLFIDCDLVTFFDSIEHLETRNISSFLAKLHTNQILISVPWFHDLGNDWFYHWKHRRENEHFHHFTAGGLCEVMESAGFTPIYHSNPEDKIRKSDLPIPNILTMAGVRN
jgi:hypothetical protein